MDNMLVISERVNGQFTAVGKAIDDRDPKVLQDLAEAQVKAGANALDINTGPGMENAPEVMKWMVESVQEVTDIPLCIDTTDPAAMEAGVKAAKTTPIINSTTADNWKMEKLFPIAKEYSAEIIALTLDEKGIPNDAESRCEHAMMIITKAMEYEVESDKIYLDPLILPVGPAQDQGRKVLDALDMFKTLCDPAPKTVVGLSNISNNTKERSLINKTYCVMLMAHGLDAAIMDPSDGELMKAIKSSDILLNNRLYADDFLRV